MAPAAGESDDCDDDASDVEPPINNELSFIPTPAITTQSSDQPPPMETSNLVSGGDQLKGEFINANMHYNEQMESPECHQVTPPKPVSQRIPDSRAPPNNHHQNQYDDSVKDELNWQQRAQATAPSGGVVDPVDLAILIDQARVVIRIQTVTVSSMTEITAKMVIISAKKQIKLLFCFRRWTTWWRRWWSL